jgi:hypothetical protein
VRCSPLMIGTLGCVAACAGLLGIEEPSERVNSEADGAAGTPDASDAGSALADVGAAGDAAPLEDASPESSGGDAADGSAPDSAGEAAVGVPCVGRSCSDGLACCYTSPTMPETCSLPATCTANGKSYVACDGPEDCGGQACCINTVAPHGAFGAVCSDTATCPAPNATVCHVGDGACDCKAGPNDCLPVTTCDGRCM